MATNPGANGPSLCDAERAAEMRAYNATLTKAVAPRSYPGRGLSGRGGRGIIRGIGSGLSVGRTALPPNAPRTGSATGMLGHHVVSSSTYPAASRGVHSAVAGRHASHASPTSTSNPWSAGITPPKLQPVQAPTLAGTLLTQQMAALGAADRAPAPSSRRALSFHQAPPPNMGYSGFGGDSAGFTASAGNAPSAPSGTFPMAPPPIPASVAVDSQANFIPPAPTSTRQLIVTNWGPDPVGPQCPAHLRQPSAPAAIAEISRLTGIPYDELTSDGITIPAPRLHAASQQQQQQRTPSGDVVMSTSAPKVQQSVDPVAWMDAKKSSRRQASSEMDIDTDDDSTVTGLDPPRASGNLQDSRWAQGGSMEEEKWDLPVKRPAPSEHITPSAAAAATLNFWNLAPESANAENARPSAIVQHVESAVSTFNAPLQSAQNGWSSGQTLAQAPKLTHARAVYPDNPLRQTSNRFPGQTSSSSQSAQNPPARVSNPFTNAPSTGQFSFGASTKMFTSTAAITVNAAPYSATPFKPAAGEKTLKDSRWA